MITTIRRSVPFKGFGKVSKLSKRFRVVVAAVTSGLLLSEAEISNIRAGRPMDDRVRQILTKLPDVDFLVEPIPREGNPERDTVLESNSIKQVNYMRESFLKVFPTQTNTVADVYFNPVTYGKSGNLQYTETLKELPKLLARKDTAGYFDACSIKMQLKRDLQQTYEPWGCLPEDYSANQLNALVISAARKRFSETTSSLNYINNVGKAQKREDFAAFDNFMRRQASVITKIASLSINDIPAPFATFEIAAFTVSPTKTNRDALIEKLHAFQSRLYNDYRANRQAFDFEVEVTKP